VFKKINGATDCSIARYEPNGEIIEPEFISRKPAAVHGTCEFGDKTRIFAIGGQKRRRAMLIPQSESHDERATGHGLPERRPPVRRVADKFVAGCRMTWQASGPQPMPPKKND
jgi:hypothetical protein